MTEPFPEIRTYHGQPVLAEPVWTWEVPVYLFAGGLAGATAGVAFASELAGREVLSRRAWGVAAAAVTACPPLLVSDLGRPERFLNMLRVFKVTSPMSVGSWLLAASGTATGIAAASRIAGTPGGSVAAPAAAALGMPLATYTGVLLANTAVPVWHEARRELPFLFAASAAASAGAAVAAATPPAHAGPARRLAIGASVVELAVARLLERRLGALAGAFRSDEARGWERSRSALTVAGAAALAGAGLHERRAPSHLVDMSHRMGGLGRPRTRGMTFAGAALTLAGALATRFAVFRAGFASARDPAHTVAPQRARLGATDPNRRP